MYFNTNLANTLYPVAWDEAEIGTAFALDHSVDICLVRRDGFGEFDPDSLGQWGKNQIGPVSGLDGDVGESERKGLVG